MIAPREVKHGARRAPFREACRALVTRWVVVTLLGSCTFVLAADGEDVRQKKDIVYHRAGDAELALDIATPVEPGHRLPVLLCIHGGGWRSGRRDAFADFLERAAKEGFAAVTISYRFAPEHTWPAQLEDVRAALRWIGENARTYSLDPQRVGAVGFSAGAHLSLLLGTHERTSRGDVPPVRAVVNFFGPTDLTRDVFVEAVDNMITDLAGGDRDAKADVLRSLSPLTHVDAGDAPVLTFHGTEDPLVPVSQAKRLHEALEKASVPNRLEILEGRQHGWGGEDLERTTRQTLEFFEMYLKPTDLPLVVREGFSHGAERWKPTDGKAWKVKKEDGDAFYSLVVKQSDYKPKVRSPYNISLLEDIVVGDFVLDVRLKSTTPDYGHRSLCLFFGHQDPEHFYYVHFGKTADAHANSVFLVNGKPRVSIAKERTDGTPWDELWHHARVRRDVESGRIEVFFDDMSRPVMVAEDRTFLHGRVGIGSFDDTGDFDDFRLWGDLEKP